MVRARRTLAARPFSQPLGPRARLSDGGRARGRRVLRRLGQQGSRALPRARDRGRCPATEDPGRRDPRRGGGETGRRVGHLLLGATPPGWPRWSSTRRSGPRPDGTPRRSAVRGCSAGVAFLTEKTFDSDRQDFDSVWAPGIGYVKDTLFGPHWDIVDTWIPGATDFIAGSVGPGRRSSGWTRKRRWWATGMPGRSWGERRSTSCGGEWTRYAEGDAFELPLRLADGPA